MFTKKTLLQGAMLIAFAAFAASSSSESQDAFDKGFNAGWNAFSSNDEIEQGAEQVAPADSVFTTQLVCDNSK